MTQAVEPFNDVRQAAPARRRTTWREDLITVAGAMWLVAGLASDAWAHSHQKPDTVLTPWHTSLYAGIAALFTWLLWLSNTGRPGLRLADRVPVGYGLGLIGALILIVGTAGDAVWHTVFGIEVSLEAVLSPTHLMGFVGLLLLTSTPLRAAWGSSRPGTAPTLGEFLPTLLSLAATVSIASIFLGHASPFGRPGATMPVSAAAPMFSMEHYAIEQGFMDIQFTNLLLMSSLLVAMRRWRLPFGSATIFLGIPTLLLLIINDIAKGWPLLAALAAGLVADWCISRSAQAADQARTHLLVAALTPLTLWSTYFLTLHLQDGITWSAELWTGSIILAVMGGYALHLLISLVRVPRPPERDTLGAGHPTAGHPTVTAR